MWLKEIAPSTELRKWFAHDKHYLLELKENQEAVLELKERMKMEDLTLVFGAKDEVHSEAVVLMKKLK